MQQGSDVFIIETIFEYQYVTFHVDISKRPIFGRLAFRKDFVGYSLHRCPYDLKFERKRCHFERDKLALAKGTRQRSETDEFTLVRA